jgi:hypothetical protein
VGSLHIKQRIREVLFRTSVANRKERFSEVNTKLLDIFTSSGIIWPTNDVLNHRNYNIMMIAAPGAQQVAERSEGIKEAVLATVLSRSL